MKRIIPTLLCIASFLPGRLPAEFRTWTNTEGKQVDAELVKAEGPDITFKMHDGKTITFPESKLSEADREFIKNNPPKAPEEPKPAVKPDRNARWQTRLSKAQAESKETGLPILILFTGSTWCPYCIKLEKGVFAEKDFKTFANQNLVLLKLDYGPGGATHDREQKKLAAQYGVRGFPTYFLVGTDGKTLAQNGYFDGIKPSTFADWVNKTLAKGK